MSFTAYQSGSSRQERRKFYYFKDIFVTALFVIVSGREKKGFLVCFARLCLPCWALLPFFANDRLGHSENNANQISPIANSTAGPKRRENGLFPLHLNGLE